MPGVLDLAGKKHRQGRISSVDAVYEELQQGDDELSKWARGMNEQDFFLSSGEEIAPYITRLSQWAEGSGFKREAIQEFNDSADLILIAYAASHDFTVVTNEKSEPEAKKKIKIPDACRAIRLEYIALAELLRKEKIWLILQDNYG